MKAMAIRKPGDHVVRVAAAQPLCVKARRLLQLGPDPEARRQHFLRYNIGASSYDEAYVRELGHDYLPYLEMWVGKAAARGAELLLLPEFCFVPGVLAAPGHGNPPNPKARADALKLYTWAGKRFEEWLVSMSRQSGLFIGAATLMVRGGRLRNTGLLADDKGKVVLRYDKIHLPSDESQNCTAGRTYDVAATRLGRIGFSICYDVQFPEAAAALAANGAQLVLHPSAGFTLPDERPDMGWNRLRVRASDHFTPWVYSSFSPVESWEPGGSCVVDGSGNLLARIAGKRCGLAVGDVVVGGKRRWPGDPDEAPDRERVRRHCRHPETYHVLERKTDQ